MTASEMPRPAPTRLHRETFKRGSRTYYNSSLFFPSEVRRDVFSLYGFVRVADDFVDQVPQDGPGLADFRRRYEDALERAADSQRSGDAVIEAFVELALRRRFPREWTEAFFHSMELDLTKRIYITPEETLEYIHGSAEVIGLYMAKLLDLPEASFPCAKMLGRAMQYINFVRDIDEDRRLGRSYLSWHGRADRLTDPEYARSHEAEFQSYIEHHIGLYMGWQREAEAGFRYIRRRYLIPIKTASDMYRWTAESIRMKPLTVFERKVKPTRRRIFLRVLRNALLDARGA